MSLTIHNKSPMYGDINQGYMVTEIICSFGPHIDARNPAVVKYARLLLGNDDAIRDSIDDIASYATKSNGKLSFEPHALPAAATIALRFIHSHVAHWSSSPTQLAYIVAFYGCLLRGSNEKAYEVLDEYAEYLEHNGFSAHEVAAIAQNAIDFKIKLSKIKENEQ